MVLRVAQLVGAAGEVLTTRVSEAVSAVSVVPSFKVPVVLA